ncbi:MAG: 30S ribosomal protein S21 [Candidatus Marinimicrobia bacterium]|nr:30S ribosomal protein S21 [Candidatus Neomarinimicrobiota bacterium]MCF7803357.1 30S ribosomal protein S21 [Candidatus Neomarinimicrobiota bacterium]MCF7827360.1 30S ribosomal protein S21 [Candidatus Neomarinimicrobiota bacterium]MCF7881407.1 30S ribosomal protein S21 [Candidatus Neomarinimicrobiota bacterium]
MIEVNVRKDESLERAMRRFQKKFQKAGIFKEIKQHSYYMKPSDEKRMKRAKAIRRQRRRSRRNKR